MTSIQYLSHQGVKYLVQWQTIFASSDHAALGLLQAHVALQHPAKSGNAARHTLIVIPIFLLKIVFFCLCLYPKRYSSFFYIVSDLLTN